MVGSLLFPPPSARAMKIASKLLTFVTISSYLTLIPGVSAMHFVTRDQWKARAPEEAYTPMTNAKGVKIHYLGSVFGGREHSECDDEMRSVQKEHMDDSPEDYFDIAYNLAVCQHGYVYDGRGKNHQSGANGNKKLNSEHYAVLVFLAKHIINEPTTAQITGIQDAIAYLRRAGAGNEIKGHKDGYDTECPGPALYKLVKDGTLDPGKLYDGGVHTVDVGDSLGSISYKYNIPKGYIIEVNHLKAPYNLVVGDKLKIPARGVPLGQEVPGKGDGGNDKGDGGSSGKLTPFPGADFFKSKPNSPIVTAMGKRLVAEGCGKYKEGPGAQWTDADLESYKCWQKKLGYTGDAADGWPGEASWDKLKVPYTKGGSSSGGDNNSDGKFIKFPGDDFFKSKPNSPTVTAMGKRLVAEGCNEYKEGPGPQWSDADLKSYQCWQKKLGYTGAAADGWPGKTSWDKLKVPKSS